MKEQINPQNLLELSYENLLENTEKELQRICEFLDEDYEMAIYNRWGEKLFETKEIEMGWDGTYKGETVTNGVYLYQIRFKTTEDLTFQNIGGILNVVR